VQPLARAAHCVGFDDIREDVEIVKADDGSILDVVRKAALAGA
jgi:hypothetical protein